MHSQDTTLSPLFDLVLLSNDAKISHQYGQVTREEKHIMNSTSQPMDLAVVLV